MRFFVKLYVMNVKFSGRFVLYPSYSSKHRLFMKFYLTYAQLQLLMWSMAYLKVRHGTEQL